ncbi:MAG: hypothetical protein FD129_1659 [bacterium]|nr:MAG: hypothetical protein FD129_1659 [bacterium]
MRKVTMSLLSLACLAATASIAGASGMRTITDPSLNTTEPSTQSVIYRSIGECQDCWAS